MGKSITISKGSIISKGHQSKQSKQSKSFGSLYDADAEAYFVAADTNKDLAKAAYNDWVVGLKSMGLYGNTVSGMPFLPSSTKFGSFTDAATNTIRGTQVYNNSNSPNPGPIYNFPRALPLANGLTFGEINGSNGAYLSGFLNDSYSPARTIIRVYQDKEALDGGYNDGSFGGNSNSNVFQKNNAATKTVRADGYTSSPTTGSARYLSAIDGGTYIQVINANNAIWENGVKKDEIINKQGNPANLEELLNGYKTVANNGGGSNNCLAFRWVLDVDVNDAQVAQLTALAQNFLTAMKRTGIYDFSLMMDGNSHTVYWNSALMDSMSDDVFGLAEVNFLQIGVSGQRLQNMLDNLSANLLPRFVAGKGAKHHIVIWEGTNEISFGTTGLDAITKLNDLCGLIKADLANKGIPNEIIVPTLLARNFPGEDQKIIESGVFNDELINNKPSNVDWVHKITNPWTSYREDFVTDNDFIVDQRALTQNPLVFEDLATHLVENAQYGYQAAVGIPVINHVKAQYAL